MKIKITAGLLAVLAALPLAAQQTPDAPKPSILILGTVHFGGSAADLFSPSVPDILTEKRQRELADMIAALKRYQPTKIAVEVTPAGIGKLNASYQAYLKGEYQLKGDEVDQLAFRLAKELGHKQLWSADTRMDMDFDAVMAAATKNGQQPLVAQAMETGRSGVQEINQKREAGTIGALFRWLNSPEMLAASHRPYLYLAQIGSAEDPKGAEVLAGWYKRNLLIYGNLVRLIESPGERILLLIGQGHAKLLSEYVGESPNLRLVDPLQYLP